MTDKLPHMTPLYHVRQAEQHFAAGKGMYKFNVPDDRATDSYIARIRSHARRRGYSWRVAHVDGQEWLIKRMENK